MVQDTAKKSWAAQDGSWRFKEVYPPASFCLSKCCVQICFSLVLEDWNCGSPTSTCGRVPGRLSSSCTSCQVRCGRESTQNEYAVATRESPSKIEVQPEANEVTVGGKTCTVPALGCGSDLSWDTEGQPTGDVGPPGYFLACCREAFTGAAHSCGSKTVSAIPFVLFWRGLMT